MARKRCSDLGCCNLVLQPKRTLDDVLPHCNKITIHGCEYRVLRYGGKVFVERGCDFFLVGLFDNTPVDRDRKLFYDWFSETPEKMKEITGHVKTKTLDILFKRNRCPKCGGHRFAKELQR